MLTGRQWVVFLSLFCTTGESGFVFSYCNRGEWICVFATTTGESGIALLSPLVKVGWVSATTTQDVLLVSTTRENGFVFRHELLQQGS